MAAPLAGRLPRWRCEASAWLERDWGLEVAVFHHRTCTTHLLGADAAALLRTMTELRGEWSAPALWSATFGGEASDNELTMLNEALQQLTQAGLVTALPA